MNNKNWKNYSFFLLLCQFAEHNSSKIPKMPWIVTCLQTKFENLINIFDNQLINIYQGSINYFIVSSCFIQSRFCKSCLAFLIFDRKYL